MLSARLTDQDLVELVRSGDGDALGEIARRHRPALVGAARRVLAGTSLEAEDAVQDVLAKLPHALRAHDRPILLEPWLRMVVRNRCLDLRRASRPVVELPFQLTGPAAADPAVIAERRQDVLRVVAGVRDLPDRQRRAFVMHAVDGVPQDAVAAALGTTVPAIKQLVRRSRSELRKATGSGGFST